MLKETISEELAFWESERSQILKKYKHYLTLYKKGEPIKDSWEKVLSSWEQLVLDSDEEFDILKELQSSNERVEMDWNYFLMSFHEFMKGYEYYLDFCEEKIEELTIKLEGEMFHG